MEKRPRKTSTENFKKQMIKLYNAVKPPRVEIVREYDLVPICLSIDGFIESIRQTGTTNEKIIEVIWKTSL